MVPLLLKTCVFGIILGLTLFDYHSQWLLLLRLRLPGFCQSVWQSMPGAWHGLLQTFRWNAVANACQYCAGITGLYCSEVHQARVLLMWLPLCLPQCSLAAACPQQPQTKLHTIKSHPAPSTNSHVICRSCPTGDGASSHGIGSPADSCLQAMVAAFPGRAGTCRKAVRFMAKCLQQGRMGESSAATVAKLPVRAAEPDVEHAVQLLISEALCGSFQADADCGR